MEYPDLISETRRMHVKVVRLAFDEAECFAHLNVLRLLLLGLFQPGCVRAPEGCSSKWSMHPEP